MKTMTALIVAMLLLGVGIQRVHAPVLAPLICIALTAAAVGAVWYLSSCGEKAYCVWDLDDSGNRVGMAYMLKLGARCNAAKYQVEIACGPFKSLEAGFPSCETNNFPAVKATVASLLGAQDIVVEMCTNLTAHVWTEFGKFVADPECFDWPLPENRPPVAAYFRLRLN